MIKLGALLSVILLVVGCQSTKTQTVEPFASKEDIAEAKILFSQNEDFEVTDDGYINYTVWIEDGYKWRTAVIRKSSREFACGDIYQLLERGFVTSITFKGIGGRTESFDVHRCDQISPE